MCKSVSARDDWPVRGEYIRPWIMHTRRSPGRSSSKARPTQRKAAASPTTKTPTRQTSKGLSHDRNHPSPSTHCETPKMDIDPGKRGKETAQAVEVVEERPHVLGYSDLGLIAVFVISCITFGLVMMSDSNNQLLHVWAYSWITAVCTGIGAIPFLLVDDVSKYWFGVCNAAAAGMMIAASVILFYEGLMSTSDSQEDANSSMLLRLFIGIGVGVCFVRFSRSRLEQYEDLKMGNVSGMDAKKVLLLMGVMTIHSLAEGVGIGVAFSGSGGSRLGALVSSTLAIHNIPEGLAVALVLVPKGFSAKGAIAWSIFSSIPQPIMAVPTFAFVAQFIHVLPYGLGFAAGAMIDVSLVELLPEAIEMTGSTNVSLLVTVISGGFMLLFQTLLQ